MNGSMYSTNGHNSSMELPALLEPYTKDELYSMVLELAQSHESMYQIVLNRIFSGDKWCKLFVHGLSPQTNKTSLMLTFQQFGHVKEAVVMLDHNFRSKCHGFVTFHSVQAARNAVCNRLSNPIMIDGQKVQCDYAFRGNPSGPKVLVQNQPVISPEQRLAADGRRLFIHDLAWKTNNETLKAAFLKYGEIQEAVVIHDRKTGKSKGFGFVTFHSAQSAQAALKQPEKRIDGRNAKVAYAKATKDGDAPPAPFQSSVPVSLSSRGSVEVDEQPNIASLKRPTLTYHEVSGESIVSNVSCGSLSTSGCNGMMEYSTSTPPIMHPVLGSTPNSGSWNAAPLYHAVNLTSSTPVGTPVPPSRSQSAGAPVSPQMVSLPPMATTPPVLGVHTPVIHPSLLLPPPGYGVHPPTPGSLGIRSSFGQELNLQGGYLVNVGMLQGIPPLPAVLRQQPAPQNMQPNKVAKE